MKQTKRQVQLKSLTLYFNLVYILTSVKIRYESNENIKKLLQKTELFFLTKKSVKLPY